MQLPLFVVDAFADRVFAGNPAAVCPLKRWIPDAILGAIAAENNLSETAFLVPTDGGFELRWFTPTTEVDLCGHATLASAFVLDHLGHAGFPLRFETREAGVLTVSKTDDGKFILDLPSRPSEPMSPPAGLSEAIGATVVEFERASKNVASLADETAVRAARPDLGYVTKMDGDGLVITAKGDSVDFVSRYFAPHAGIAEDPVTGSAHCTLTPLWAKRLGKTKLAARQVSRRGGNVACELVGDRVQLGGTAVLYLEGMIRLAE